MAMHIEPRIVEKIQEIVLIGDSHQHGNVTSAAEINIYSDAEAAHIVFSCGQPLVMMGLGVILQALCYLHITYRK
jgi:ribosylpyrimidine nucleosidase